MSCLHGPLCGSLKPLLGYEKGITDSPLFFLEDSATSSSLIHDVHTGSWALQDFASGRSRGGSLGCTLLPSLPGSWSLGLGRQSPSVGGRLDTQSSRGRDLGSPAEQEQKECWQVSWGPPQNKDLDQDEMYPGLVTKCDGWLEGSGEILMCLSSSPRHTDFPCLLSQSLHSCLCWPKL